MARAAGITVEQDTATGQLHKRGGSTRYVPDQLCLSLVRDELVMHRGKYLGT